MIEAILDRDDRSRAAGRSLAYLLAAPDGRPVGRMVVDANVDIGEVAFDDQTYFIKRRFRDGRQSIFERLPPWLGRKQRPVTNPYELSDVAGKVLATADPRPSICDLDAGSFALCLRMEALFRSGWLIVRRDDLQPIGSLAGGCACAARLSVDMPGEYGLPLQLFGLWIIVHYTFNDNYASPF